MRAMLTAFAAIVVIAIVAFYALREAGFSSAEVKSGSDVRLDQ